MTLDIDYASSLRQHFQAHADAASAEKMQKYMLNQFPFFGIPSPLRKELVRAFIAEQGLPQPCELDEVVKQVWNLPERELHYAIMEIAARPAFLKDEGRPKLYRFMIKQFSWWDTVDFIASNLVGAWLKRHPDYTVELVQEYLDSDSMWLQRTALLFQLKYRQATNEALLFEAIQKLNHSKEFFIRKAIGWALREYSKTNPQAVIDFVANTTLQPLSSREAMRIILKNKLS